MAAVDLGYAVDLIPRSQYSNIIALEILTCDSLSDFITGSITFLYFKLSYYLMNWPKEDSAVL